MQQPSQNAVKYGYGMIHALIVTKSPASLDLLLQQGANPNAMSMSQLDEDRVCVLNTGRTKKTDLVIGIAMLLGCTYRVV